MKRLVLPVVLPLVGLCLAAATAFGGQTRPAPAAGAFDVELARLKAGRSYKAEAPGVRTLETIVNGTRLDNTLIVPDGYDPAKRWPLRVQLHGGVGRLPPQQGGSQARALATNRIPSDGELVLQPRAYATAQWWERSQVDNINGLIEKVKQAYNVDESRIYLTGISDGGTGVYFFAMRSATAWSACLPLNGHPSVLANPDVGADGDLFVSNLVNCPLYLVNGGKDRLYPAASVAPLVDMIKRAGVPVLFNVYPEAGHDTSWWPEERPKFEAFVRAHPRPAYPDRISWATERTDRYNRFRWLVVDRLAARPSDGQFDDVNSFRIPGREILLYSRSRQWGRVDVARSANTFTATTRGVEQFTLLLSPDVIDFAKPVKVIVNGRAAFEGTVKQDVATLTKWAARDNDRTMVFGGEITIHVP